MGKTKSVYCFFILMLFEIIIDKPIALNLNLQLLIAIKSCIILVLKIIRNKIIIFAILYGIYNTSKLCLF